MFLEPTVVLGTEPCFTMSIGPFNLDKGLSVTDFQSYLTAQQAV